MGCNKCSLRNICGFPKARRRNNFGFKAVQPRLPSPDLDIESLQRDAANTFIEFGSKTSTELQIGANLLIQNNVWLFIRINV